MFQLAFGLNLLDSGLLLLAVFAGNLGMKPATSRRARHRGGRAEGEEAIVARMERSDIRPPRWPDGHPCQQHQG
jgi:hypothetical protein